MQMMNEDSKTLRTLLWLGIPFLAILTLALLFVAANRPPVVNVPTRKMPNPNGWDDLVKATTLLIPTGPYSDAPRKPEDWTESELRAWVQTETPALDMMRQGLAKECMHPPMRTPFFEGYAPMRELARINAGAALYYEVIGKHGRAADSVIDGIEFSTAVEHGAPLLGGLVGIAIESIAIRHLEPLLPKLSPKELALAAARMEKISAKRVPFGDILIEESRINAAAMSDVFCTGNRVAVACDFQGSFARPKASTLERVRHSVSFAFANKNAMIIENRAYLEKVAREQRRPYTGTTRVPAPRNPLTTFALGGEMYVWGRGAFVRNDTFFVILQTEVALLRYRANHGRFPSSLAELAPAYLKSVPIDPFGLGKPLRYRQIRGGKSYLLYSLGSDLKDDRGKSVKEPYAVDGSPGDIAAGKLPDAR